MPDAFVRFDRVGKRFGGVTALDDVSFSVDGGTIHAVVGENGAGKSTLMKIVAAVYPHGGYDGEVLLDGKACRFARVPDAEAAGIALIPQELAVVGELSVAENMFLNSWPGGWGVVDWAALFDQTREHLERIGLQVDPDTPIKSLSAAHQQMVLIAKALAKSVRLLVLDEPTSSLSTSEAGVLFDRLRALRRQGITSLYISHKIDEVFEIADVITVLRDGRHVVTRDKAAFTPETLVSSMVGRPMSQMYPRMERQADGRALRIRGLTAFVPHLPQIEENAVLHSIDLDLDRGTILGIYGLVGAGRTELLMTVFGAWPGVVAFDTFEVFGVAVTPVSPRTMMEHGIGLLTEDRKRSGIVPGEPVRTNLTLASLDKISRGLLLDEPLERTRATKLAEELGVKAPSIDTAIDNLSGGNQQKVLLGRWLSAESTILLLDDPTRGVDVGAKVEIFHILNRLAAQGVAIVFVTSELPEVLGVADRILVMHEGRMVANLEQKTASEEIVMRYAAGQG